LADETTPPDEAAVEEPATDPVAETPETESAPAPEPEPEPELDPVVADLLERLSAELGDALTGHVGAFGTLTVRVKPEAWRATAEFAKRALACDYLSFISAIDWQPAPKADTEDTGDTSSPAQPAEMTTGNLGADGRFTVFAHVQSTAKHWGVTIKTDVDDASPHLASWVPVYAGADWHERECWEMFGVAFDGHPSLRRLYLPSDFEGHPLRKDFALLAREVKPWPGLVDVEPMPGEDEPAEAAAGGDDS
jgi:NADH-quinone oxidoreductase subunit C